MLSTYALVVLLVGAAPEPVATTPAISASTPERVFSLDAPVALTRPANASHSAALELQGAEYVQLHAGESAQRGAARNRGSLRFDGQTSIAHWRPGPQDPRCEQGFTWQGFFFAPSTAPFDPDKAVGDRFITQFADASGGQTRLAVGLSSLAKDGPWMLSIALPGTDGRIMGSIPVTRDAWHHFAVVQRGTGTEGKITWYLDYEQCGQVTLTGRAASSTLLPPGPAPWAIGARQLARGKADRGFAGLLDELRITDRALEVSQLQRRELKLPEALVQVEWFGPLVGGWDWNDARLAEPERLRQDSLSLAAVPRVFSMRGFDAVRHDPYVVRASRRLSLPAGSYQVRVATPHEAVLSYDGVALIDTRRPAPTSAAAEQPAAELTVAESTEALVADGGPHWLSVTSLVPPGDATSHRVVITYAGADGIWRLLGSDDRTAYDEFTWAAYEQRTRMHFEARSAARREQALARAAEYWEARHGWARAEADRWPVAEPPSTGHPIDAFLAQKQQALGVEPAPLVDDAAFLRRLSLDLQGRIPSADELATFEADPPAERRSRAVERMLASAEWVDGWMGYWQDVLAENPSILKPHLNNSGAFRYYLQQALAENLPLDRFVTELVLMEGPDEQGGTSGFALAADNDLPMAMKAHIVAGAFLAVDLKCARCHDSPTQPYEQRDLFSLAAMLDERPIRVPVSSVVTVPPGGRVPAVTSTLAAGEQVAPDWPLEELIGVGSLGGERPLSDRPRARLAAAITAPHDPRFSDVLVNRVWKRYFGLALAEPVDQWLELSDASHPELLRWLSRELVRSGYDLKALVRLVVTSDAYARVSRADEAEQLATTRTYAWQGRRRASAEQLVDSLYAAMGKSFGAEELNFDPNGTQGFLTLPAPRRAWQFASMSNERDRPALAMPVNQSIVDVLVTFGWRENRMDPLTVREESPTPLQPLMLANGMLSEHVVRLTERSGITELCLADVPLEALVDRLFVTLLSRRPDEVERAGICSLLEPGFATRRTGRPCPEYQPIERARVDWDVHLDPEASVALMEYEKRARAGDPPTVRLADDFRQRVEDVVWALVNSPEFVFLP